MAILHSLRCMYSASYGQNITVMRDLKCRESFCVPFDRSYTLSVQVVRLIGTGKRNLFD